MKKLSIDGTQDGAWQECSAEDVEDVAAMLAQEWPTKSKEQRRADMVGAIAGGDRVDAVLAVGGRAVASERRYLGNCRGEFRKPRRATRDRNRFDD